MEENTKALEVVCQHFKTEYSDETIENLRKRLAKAYKRNSSLNHMSIKRDFEKMSMKLLNVFLLSRWKELVQDLMALNGRIALP